MSGNTAPINPQQALHGHLWWAEAYRSMDDPYDDLKLVIECAELADELWHHRVAAEADPEFWDELSHWYECVQENWLSLPLEQSCHEGVLLPTDMRAMRLISCPEDMLQPLRRFFLLCPRHVRSHLALYTYLTVRMERARRTGSPEWRPTTALPEPEERYFFRPPILKLRSPLR